MRVNTMHNAQHDLKAIMSRANSTHHKLRESLCNYQPLFGQLGIISAEPPFGGCCSRLCPYYRGKSQGCARLRSPFFRTTNARIHDTASAMSVYMPHNWQRNVSWRNNTVSWPFHMNIICIYPSDIYWSQTLYSQFYPDSMRQEKHLRFDHKFVFTRRSG